MQLSGAEGSLEPLRSALGGQTWLRGEVLPVCARQDGRKGAIRESVRRARGAPSLRRTLDGTSRLDRRGKNCDRVIDDFVNLESPPIEWGVY